MIFSNVSTSTNIIVAVIVFVLLAILEPFLESWLHRLLAANQLLQWCWDQLVAPLLRAGTLIILVYLAYPEIFNLGVAPTIGVLIAEQQDHTLSLLSVLCLTGFLATFIPKLGIKSEIILPIQACLLCGLLFSALTNYLGVTTTTLWPGTDIFLLIVCVVYFGRRLNQIIAKTHGHRLDSLLRTQGSGLVIASAIKLLTQVPIILFFGQGLGRQLAI